MQIEEVNKMLRELVIEGHEVPLQKKDPRILGFARKVEAARDKLFVTTPNRIQWTELLGPGVVADIQEAGRSMAKLLDKLRRAYHSGEFEK